MDQLIRDRLHQALDVEPTPVYLRSKLIRALPAVERRSSVRMPNLEWARPWAAALIAIAVVAGLVYVGRTLGPQLVHKTPRSVPPAFVSAPRGMAVGPNGSLYFADFISGYVFRLLPDGSLVTVAGTRPDAPISEGGAGDNGPATKANLFGPAGLAFDALGNLFIADANGNRIRKVDVHGVITTYAGSGPADGSNGTFAGDGGPALAARLNFPYGIASDPQGDLYVADMGNGKVRLIDRTGHISSLDESGLPLPQSQFHPYQLQFDASGDLIVLTSDYANTPVGMGCQILRRPASGVWSVVAGTGVCGFTGDGGPATAAEITGYGGLAFDSAGNLYFLDSDNGRIRRIDRSGVITTVRSGLQGPEAMAIGPGDLLYLSEPTNDQPACSQSCTGRPTSRISVLRLSDSTVSTIVTDKTPIHTSG